MKRARWRPLRWVLLPVAVVAVVLVRREPARGRVVPPSSPAPAVVPVPVPAVAAGEAPPESSAWPALRYALPEVPESLVPAAVPTAVLPEEALAAPVAAKTAPPEAAGQPETADLWPGQVVVAAAEPVAKHRLADAWASISPLLSATEGLSFFIPDHSAGSGVWVPTAPVRAVGAGVRFRWSF